MKKFRLLILISFIALTGGVLWKLWPSKANVPNGTSEGSKASETKSAFPTSAKVIKPDLRPSQPPQTHKNSMTSDPVYQYIQNVRADPQYDWKQPISFYGQVLDENDQPISEANAHFKWTDLSENGTSEADTKSDINGYFSLVNRTGKRMSVTVSKPGYYTPHSERLSSFEYANPADGLFTPDPNEPVIFHLRKKGHWR